MIAFSIRPITTMNTSGHHGSQNELLMSQEDELASISDDDEFVDTVSEATHSTSSPRANILDLLRDSSLRNRSLILGLQW